MQTFYMVVQKGKVNLYVREGSRLVGQYINGNPEFCYKLNHAAGDMQRLFQSLVDEYNLDSVAELEIIMIENEDAVCSQVVGQALGEYVVERKGIGEAISKAWKRLVKDKKLMVQEYGINFDGKNYKIESERVKKSGFSLLGYTLDPGSLMKYIE